MKSHDFRRFLTILSDLNPAQVEDVQMKITTIRRETEAISEIEARTTTDVSCPYCGATGRQRWGRTRTKVQRYRCDGCRKTYSGRTGSAIGRIHRPELFLVVLKDMFDADAPSSVRSLAKRLGLNKYTVWRWRIQVFKLLGPVPAKVLSGVLEADETFQRESRKGSREWVNHFADPLNVPAPPRPRWEDFTTNGLKMMRGLSRWQLPILTVVDRSGERYLKRIRNRRKLTIERAVTPLVPNDAVLCSDGAKGYESAAAKKGVPHVKVGSKAGTRVISGCYHIQNANSLHARYGAFIRPFCGPSRKFLDGYIRWFEMRLEGLRPAEIFRSA